MDAVNNMNTREEVLTGGVLSDQQRAILDAIAQVEPGGVDDKTYSRWGSTPCGTAGYYHPSDVARKLGLETGDRSVSASFSRSLARLEDRGFILRRPYGDGGKSGYKFFTLTDAGIERVNLLRSNRNLPALVKHFFPDKRPMTDEEFAQRAEKISAEYKLIAAKHAAELLTPEGLLALREWINERLTSSPS